MFKLLKILFVLCLLLIVICLISGCGEVVFSQILKDCPVRA